MWRMTRHEDFMRWLDEETERSYGTLVLVRLGGDVADEHSESEDEEGGHRRVGDNHRKDDVL